jgi:putative NADH-flavin reductase
MKIVLYGATGNSGQRILQELTKRGHEVTAVARDISKLPPTVKAVKDDLSNVGAIASVVAGADVVVSAYAPPPDNTDALLGLRPSRRPVCLVSSWWAALDCSKSHQA